VDAGGGWRRAHSNPWPQVRCYPKIAKKKDLIKIKKKSDQLKFFLTQRLKFDKNV
jgi:hypothetical protein